MRRVTRMIPVERLKAEIVHSLFVDLVGFSLGPIEQQQRLVQELRDVVRATGEY